MSMWDQAQTAPIGNGQYVKPGGYIVQILNCTSQEPGDSFKGVGSFATEYTILWGHPQNPPDASQPGEVLSWVQMLGGTVPIKLAFASVNEFLAAVLRNPQLIDPRTGKPINRGELGKQVTSPANPLAGARVLLEATMRQTKAKEPWTKHEWRAVTDDILRHAGLAA